MELSKIPPTLPNMPWNIKKSIVENAETRTKFSLRQCSNEYNSFVQKSTIHYDRLYLGSTYHNSVLVSLAMPREAEVILGFQQGTGVFSRRRLVNGEYGPGVVFNGQHFIEAAVEQFLKVFRTRVSLSSFAIRVAGFRIYGDPVLSRDRKDRILTKIQTFLSTLKHKLLVEQLELDLNGEQPEDVMKILPYLKSGTLKRISLRHYPSHHDNDPKCEMRLDEIADTEQWKQAKDLGTCMIYMTLPFEKWAHFCSSNVTFREFPVEKLKEMLEVFLANPEFKSCWVNCRNLNHRVCLEYLLRFNPSLSEVNSEPFEGIDVRIESDEKNDMKVRVSKWGLRFRNIAYTHDDEPDEEPVKLEVSEVMEKLDQYFI